MDDEDLNNKWVIKNPTFYYLYNEKIFKFTMEKFIIWNKNLEQNLNVSEDTQYLLLSNTDENPLKYLSFYELSQRKEVDIKEEFGEDYESKIKDYFTNSIFIMKNSDLDIGIIYLKNKDSFLYKLKWKSINELIYSNLNGISNNTLAPDGLHTLVSSCKIKTKMYILKEFPVQQGRSWTNDLIDLVKTNPSILELRWTSGNGLGEELKNEEKMNELLYHIDQWESLYRLDLYLEKETYKLVFIPTLKNKVDEILKSLKKLYQIDNPEDDVSRRYEFKIKRWVDIVWGYNYYQLSNSFY